MRPQIASLNERLFQQPPVAGAALRVRSPTQISAFLRFIAQVSARMGPNLEARASIRHPLKSTTKSKIHAGHRIQYRQGTSTIKASFLTISR